MSFTAASLLAQMQRLPVPRRYWIAFSGGVDSHALLHALCECRTQFRVPLAAFHVHHGLQKEADQWVVHCQRICAQLNIELTVLRVNAQASNGASPEAAARQARYAAISQLMQPDDMIVSAHHQNDQAETVLLQLIRGAGVNGLAGMPLCSRFGQGYLVRPMLGFTRAMIETYAQQHQLNWVEDPSNSNTAFDRNYIRQQIMPVLNSRWPMHSATLSRAATHLAEAAELLNVLAAEDWLGVQSNQHQVMSVAALLELAPARQRNVLRYWLKEVCGLPLPDTQHLARIRDEILSARADATPEVSWPGAVVRRYQENLYAMAPLPAFTTDWTSRWDLAQPLILPDGVQQLRACPAIGAGLRLDMLQHGVEVRFRHGGETVQLPGRGHHHALKKLLQEWGVPPWQRERIPLIYVQGELAQVAGHCICAPFLAAPDTDGVVIELINRTDTKQ